MISDYNIVSAVLTHPGRKRPHNEDYVAFFESDDLEEVQQSGRLYIVADGVGGAAKGERASQYAAQKVLYDFFNDDDLDVGARLRRALRRAGNEIYDHIKNSGRFTKMGTTMVAAVVRRGQLTVANVGDSRAYLIRDGEAKQLTRDHTIAGEMLREGEVSEAEAMRVKGKHRLTRSLGGERDVHVDIYPDIPLQPGDRILLCSDGLAQYSLSEDIARLVMEGDPEDVVHGSVEYANCQGGSDNITVALIEVGQPVDLDTVTVQRGVVPTQVEWDAMVTETSMRSVRRRRLRFTTRQLLILGVLAFGLIVLGVVIVLVVVPSLGLQDSGTNTPIPSQDVTRSPVAEEGPVDETTNVTEVAAETPEATLSSTPPISPSLPKPTESPTPVVPQVFLLGAHWDSESQACLYKVKDGDNALDITKSFLSSEEINENKQDQLVKEVYIHILEKDIWEIVGDVLDREDVL